MIFNEFYIHWYSRMKNFACEYVISEDDAEDIVQDVFMDVYQKYNELSSRVNIIGYIFVTLRHRCIDHLRSKIAEQKSLKHVHEEQTLTLLMKFDSLEILDENLFNEDSIETIVQNALAALPERCREIFIRFRIEGKKRKEIAEEMNLSPKTIENQIAIAYKKLREELKNYSPILFLF